MIILSIDLHHLPISTPTNVRSEWQPGILHRWLRQASGWDWVPTRKNHVGNTVTLIRRGVFAIWRSTDCKVERSITTEHQEHSMSVLESGRIVVLPFSSADIHGTHRSEYLWKVKYTTHTLWRIRSFGRNLKAVLACSVGQHEIACDWKPVPQGLVVTQRTGVGFVFPLLLLICLSTAAPAKTRPTWRRIYQEMLATGDEKSLFNGDLNGFVNNAPWTLTEDWSQRCSLCGNHWNKIPGNALISLSDKTHHHNVMKVYGLPWPWQLLRILEMIEVGMKLCVGIECLIWFYIVHSSINL